MYCGAAAAFLAPKVHSSCTHCSTPTAPSPLGGTALQLPGGALAWALGVLFIKFQNFLLAPRKFGELIKCSHLSNNQGGGNKRGGSAKVPESINEEEGINEESRGQNLKKNNGDSLFIREMRVLQYPQNFSLHLMLEPPNFTSHTAQEKFSMSNILGGIGLNGNKLK